MPEHYDIDPADVDWTDTAIENAARAMYEDEWGGWDEATEHVRSTYRRRASAVAAAGLLSSDFELIAQANRLRDELEKRDDTITVLRSKLTDARLRLDAIESPAPELPDMPQQSPRDQRKRRPERRIRAELAERDTRIAKAIAACDEMISQLVSGPELDDVHAIRRALTVNGHTVADALARRHEEK